MLRFGWCLAALVAAGSAAGCSADTPPERLSGTRLRAVWEVADGAWRLVRWYDTRLGENCNFPARPPGNHWSEQRCLPVDWPITKGVIPSFGDAADDAVSAPQPGVDYAAAQEAPDDQGQLWLRGDDGARVPFGGWDGRRAIAATLPRGVGRWPTMPEIPPPVEGPFVGRWAPWRWTLDDNGHSYFTNSGCTAPANVAPQVVSIVEVIAHFDPLSGQLIRLFELGAIHTDLYFKPPPSGSVFNPTPDTCQPFPAGGFEFGPEIPAASLEVAGTTQLGQGRMRVEQMTLQGKPVRNARGGSLFPLVPPRDAFFDRGLGDYCIPLVAYDGVTRCFPAMKVSTYADPDCTQPILRGSDEVAYVTQLGPIPDRFQARPVLWQTTVLNDYWQWDLSGSCIHYAFGPQTVRLLGAPIAPSQLVEVKTVVDAP